MNRLGGEQLKEKVARMDVAAVESVCWGCKSGFARRCWRQRRLVLTERNVIGVGSAREWHYQCCSAEGGAGCQGICWDRHPRIVGQVCAEAGADHGVNKEEVGGWSKGSEGGRGEEGMEVVG